MKIDFKPTRVILRSKGFGINNRLQKYVDVQVARRMEPYVPFYQGALRGSVKNSRFGSGVLEYKTPYAKAQFYKGRKAGTKAQALLEGRRWDKRFEAVGTKKLARDIERYGRTI